MVRQQYPLLGRTAADARAGRRERSVSNGTRLTQYLVMRRSTRSQTNRLSAGDRSGPEVPDDPTLHRHSLLHRKNASPVN